MNIRKCPSMILIITSICAFLITSCSKDADLLSEYVIQDDQNLSLNNLLVNDTFTTTRNSTIILDVLANDNITNIENVKITSTTDPKFGEIEILEDNTLKFVVPEVIHVEETEAAAVETTEESTVAPADEPTVETATVNPAQEITEETVTETIVYTTETTNSDNTVQTDSATVIVTIVEENTNQFNLLSVTELIAKADFAIYNRQLPSALNDTENESYNGEYGRILRICENGDQGDIYNLDVLQGMVALFEASGDKKYINDVIEAYTVLFNTAKPSKDLSQSGASFDDNYLSWWGNPNFNLTLSGIVGQQQLSESRSFMHLSRLLWVMHHSPNLRGETNSKNGNTYQKDYEYLLNFLETNFWDKWFARNSLIFQHSGVDSSAAWAYIAWNLWDITNNNKFKTIYDRFNEDIGIEGVNGGMRQHLDTNSKNSSAYQWNTSFNDNPYQGRSITDHGHAARVVKFMVEDYTNGAQFYNEIDMQKLMNSISVFWPNSLEAEGEIYYWMDGEFQTGYEKKRNFMPEGWMSLGRFDENLQSRFEKMFTGYFDENRTEGVFWGELAYNKAYLEGSIKYPEN
ncbi:hypothetical protein [uncultured Maribacter sp.]|uniref:hypothetical protein n=1 Tax=uncultured Maribacter sp. TaxID=431308 RepID=UPI0030DC8531